MGSNYEYGEYEDSVPQRSDPLEIKFAGKPPAIKQLRSVLRWQ